MFASLPSCYRFVSALALLLQVPFVMGQSASGLQVTVTGITELVGSVKIAVYNDDEHWLNSKAEVAPFRAASRAVTSGDDITVVFEDVPPGIYAVSIFQDLDGDEGLDTNFIGFPKEPFGFSAPMGKFGPPDFETASIEVGEQGGSVSIELN